MKTGLDTTGLKFVIKFTASVYLLYISVGFFSNLFFANLYFGGATQATGPEGANLATVVVSEIPLEDIKSEIPAITLGFVGDIMLDRGVENVVKSRGAGDFKFVFQRVERELNDLDFLFGNLEGPISDKGRDLGGLYSFRADPEALDGLLSAGFDVVSLANNHAGDWGREALEDSLGRLSVAGIGVAGAGLSRDEAYAPFIKDVGGTRIATFSFTESAGMYGGANVARTGEGAVRASIESTALSGEADFIIAHFHFGDEYQREPNERQKRLARLAIDAGADLVVGSHPHVTQTLEKYGGGFIVYSLGNFVFDQHFSEETMRGWLFKVELREGEIAGMELCDTFINPFFQPTIVFCNLVSTE